MQPVPAEFYQSMQKIIKTGEQLLLTAAECGGLIAQYKQNEDGQ